MARGLFGEVKKARPARARLDKRRGLGKYMFHAATFQRLVAGHRKRRKQKRR